MKTVTYFEIDCGGFTKIESPDNQRKHCFDTAEEAISVAKLHKENPRLWNSKMTDENVVYWKKQVLTIVKKTITIEEIVVI